MSYFWDFYEREQINFACGKGCYLYTRGIFREEKYLDFNCGGAVNNLGYGNKAVKKALIKQAKTGLWHSSNYYKNKKAEKLAHMLCKATGFEKVFFTNSGTEAVELAIKAVRKYSEKKEIICLENGFHGRTFGAMSASFNTSKKEIFAPLLEGFVFAKPSIKDLEEKITPNTAAIIMEPVQGAEGMNYLGLDFLKDVKTFCVKNNILLILDEIQTGMGRTGKLFMHQHTEASPDILLSSKAIASGFPFGAVFTFNNIALNLQNKSHGGTFNSNLLGVEMAIATFKQINSRKILNNALKISALLEKALADLQSHFPSVIEEIKGYGMLRGLKINEKFNAKEIMFRLTAEEKLLVGLSNFNVLRITPPIIINEKELMEGISKLKKLFKTLR